MTKRSGENRSAGDCFVIWLACIVALAAGCYIAFGLLGTAIDRQQQLTARVAGLQLTQARTLARRPALERDERTIEARLRVFDLRADKPTLAARFIRATTRIAAKYQVNLDGVEGRSAPATPVPTTEAASLPGGAVSFEAIPLDVTLSGSYRGLLAAISELTQAPVAMQIDVAAIERNASPAATTSDAVPLTARLHITLQRLANDAPAVSLRLPAPEDVTTHARPF